MFAYTTPGVYFDWLDAGRRAFAPRRTDIAGLIGIAERGPLHLPWKVESWTQYTSVFGRHIPQGLLAYAVEGFFENGGRTCWIVRVADPDQAQPATLDLTDAAGTRTLRLTASSPGTWGSRVTVTVIAGEQDFSLIVGHPGSGQELWRNLHLRPPSIELLDGAGRPTLRVRVLDPPLWTRPVTFVVGRTSAGHFSLRLVVPELQDTRWSDLSMDSSQANYVKTVLERGGQLAVDDLHSPSGLAGSAPDPLAPNLSSGRIAVVVEPGFAGRILNDGGTGSRLVRVNGVSPGQGLPTAGVFRLGDGADGLATLTPVHMSGQGAPPEKTWGLEIFNTIDEISVVAFTDLRCTRPAPPSYRPVPPRCDVLDLEPEPPPFEPPSIEYPPIFSDLQIVSLQRALIGQCEARKDRVAILDVRPEDDTPEEALAWRTQFDTSFAALYFPWLQVNDPVAGPGVLRQVPVCGHIAGIYARGDLKTGVHKPPANEVIAGTPDVIPSVDDIAHGALNTNGVNAIRVYPGRGVRVAGARTLSSDSLWRYINVRRLLCMIEETIDEDSQWTVFEPSNPELWREISRVIRNFLDELWRRGMLDGARAEDAYFVRCDETTNPPEETEAGRLTCLIGVQPPWPAEFVVVRIGKTENRTEIEELSGAPDA
jgi:uncharacterized protein